MRQRALELYAVLATVVAGALIVERHRATWSESTGEWKAWHGLAIEGALLPFVLVAAVVPACLWARRRAPRGALAGALGLLGALAIWMTLLIAHLFEHTQSNDAGHVAGIGSLGLAVGAIGLFVSEPIAAVRAREGRGPALRDVAVTGRRRKIRDVFVVGLCAIAGLLALWLLLEHHDEIPLDDYEAPPRREWFVADTYGLVLLGPLAVVVTALRARRGFPHGVVAGLVAFAAALAMGLTWSLQHTITHTSDATEGALLAMLALFFLGPAFAITDAVVHGRERRRTDTPPPELPPARVSR